MNKTTYIIVLIMGGMMTLLGGCGFYSIFISPLIPEKTIKAEVNLKNDSLLIWVDMKIHEGENEILLRREMTEKLRDLLLAREAAKEIIPYEDVTRFRRQNALSSAMNPEELGSQMKVDKVLYVLVEEFRMVQQTDNGFYDLHLGGHARLVDTATGKRLWPLGLPEKNFIIGNDIAPGSGPTFVSHIIRQVSNEFARLLGPSFYDHKQGKI